MEYLTKVKKKIIKNYKNNLKKLNLQIKAWNIKPILPKLLTTLMEIKFYSY